ncbi:MAG: TetR family transcriptional regulator [Myxococcales bacterium]|nr:TetR family transcriptional regulator [Myxococcales bacterium]
MTLHATDGDLGRREQKKRETRARLVAVASDLFETQGYDATSIEEIAEAAGISRRTYFRYFPSKEDIAFPYREDRLERFDALIQGGAADETGWQSVKRACLVMAGDFMREREMVIRLERIVASHAALRAASREYDRGWEQAIQHGIARDASGDETTERAARLTAGALMGLVRATLDYWVEHDGEPNLIEIAHEVFELIERGGLATYPHFTERSS